MERTGSGELLTLNRLTLTVDHTARAILRDAGAVTLVGAFFGYQLPDIADDLFILLHHEPVPLCFVNVWFDG